MIFWTKEEYDKKWRESRRTCSTALRGLSDKIGNLSKQLEEKKQNLLTEIKALEEKKKNLSEVQEILAKMPQLQEILGRLNDVKDRLERVKAGIDKTNLTTSEEWDSLPGGNRFNPVTFNRKFKFYRVFQKEFCEEIKGIGADFDVVIQEGKKLISQPDSDKDRDIDIDLSEWLSNIEWLICNNDPKKTSIEKVLQLQWDKEQRVKINKDSGSPKFKRIGSGNEEVDPEKASLIYEILVAAAGFILIIIAVTYPAWNIPQAASDLGSDAPYWQKLLANQDGLYAAVTAIISISCMVGVMIYRKIKNRKIYAGRSRGHGHTKITSEPEGESDETEAILGNIKSIMDDAGCPEDSRKLLQSCCEMISTLPGINFNVPSAKEIRSIVNKLILSGVRSEGDKELCKNLKVFIKTNQQYNQ